MIEAPSGRGGDTAPKAASREERSKDPLGLRPAPTSYRRLRLFFRRYEPDQVQRVRLSISALRADFTHSTPRSKAQCTAIRRWRPGPCRSAAMRGVQHGGQGYGRQAITMCHGTQQLRGRAVGRRADRVGQIGTGGGLSGALGRAGLAFLSDKAQRDCKGCNGEQGFHDRGYCWTWVCLLVLSVGRAGHARTPRHRGNP